VKNATLREKSLIEEIKSLKSQLAAKEKERMESIEALHDMESKCILLEPSLKQRLKILII
jgi:hypothetical protein